MASKNLTAGEECQQAAKCFSAFVDTKQPGAIPPSYITSAMGVAIIRGDKGVAVVRLKTGEWSAPCAIEMENPSGTIQVGQETVLLFMTENSILKLVSRALVQLGKTHQFAPGALDPRQPINPNVDVYCYVRFNAGFTPQELIASNMVSWLVREDPVRHSKWHGQSVTWFDVLTNKITVDRSSVGNALYVVLNLAAGSASAIDLKRKNYADVDTLTGIAPSVTDGRNQRQPQSHQHQPVQAHPQQQHQQQSSHIANYGQANGAASFGQPTQSPDYHQQLYQQHQHQLLQMQQQQHFQHLQQQQQQQQQQQPGFQYYQPQMNMMPQQQQQQMQPGMTAGSGQGFSYEQALQQQALAHQQYAMQMQGQALNQPFQQGMNPGQWNQ
ncbi:hypothetical protein HDU85_004636 [Gaertneriomyces sp. JEL0708]|nr:hypothetical protein HDU85_004636 [Gaertneriomyces sp. JEL0708]